MEPQGKENGPSADRTDDNGRTRSPADAFSDLGQRVGELRAYIAYYAAARRDAIVVAVRNTAFYAVLGLGALLAGAVLLISAVVLICLGLAYGLSAAFGSVWLGHLTAGLIVIALIVLTVMLAKAILWRSFRRKTVERYEQWKKQQRREFGKDVRQRAVHQ